MRDHLFEWYMSREVAKRALALKRKRKSSAQKRTSPLPLTDLQMLFLAYDDRAQLNLADVKPAGLLFRGKL